MWLWLRRLGYHLNFMKKREEVEIESGGVYDLNWLRISIRDFITFMSSNEVNVSKEDLISLTSMYNYFRNIYLKRRSYSDLMGNGIGDVFLMYCYNKNYLLDESMAKSLLKQLIFRGEGNFSLIIDEQMLFGGGTFENKQRILFEEIRQKLSKSQKIPSCPIHALPDKEKDEVINTFWDLAEKKIFLKLEKQYGTNIKNFIDKLENGESGHQENKIKVFLFYLGILGLYEQGKLNVEEL